MRGALVLLGVFLLVLVACAREEIIAGPASNKLVTQKEVPLSEYPGANIQTCDKAVDATSYVACIQTLAITLDDPEACDKLTEKYPAGYTIQDQPVSYWRDACLFAYVEETNKLDVCKKIVDEDQRFICLNKFR